jgi:hypothetical protein
MIQFDTLSLNYNSNKATYKEFFECSGIGFVMYSGLFILVLEPLYFGGPLLSHFKSIFDDFCYFFISNPFLTIFVTFSFQIRFWRFLFHQMCGEKGIEILFGHLEHNWTLPLDLACLECLNACSPTILPVCLSCVFTHSVIPCLVRL